jgi:hypothetical protein
MRPVTKQAVVFLGITAFRVSHEHRVPGIFTLIYAGSLHVLVEA